MQKHLFYFLFFTFSFSFVSSAQIRAVTSTGDEVILNDDGTWRYAQERATGDKAETKTDTSKIKYSKPAGAFFLVKSKRIPFGVFIDPKKWTFEKSDEADAAEFDFTLKAKDAFATMITEKIGIPLPTLKMAAVANAKKASDDMRIVKEEYREVNGKYVLHLQMDGTVSGIKFTYFGYYFSTDKGTMQLVGYTATNLLSEYKKSLEDLLNGFVEVD